MRWTLIALALVISQTGLLAAEDDVDPNLWLEEVTGDRALDWVRDRNAETAKELETGAAFKTLESGILAIMDSDAKIPYVTKNGAYYYNFWKDAAHSRGLPAHRPTKPLPQIERGTH